MTVYKYFTKIALKNRGIILSYIFIFFLISLINGSNIAEREASFVSTELNIGIVDNSNSKLSESLRDYLEKNHNLIEMVDDDEVIREQMFLEVVNAVIIIPEDFDQKVINQEEAIELYRDDRKAESIQIENQVNKFLTFVNATYEGGEFNLADVKLALDEEARVEMVGTEEKVDNYGVAAWFKIYYNFASYIIIAIYIAVIGVIMSDFTNKNIEDRMKIASKKFLKFNIEIYLGQLTVAALITLVFILGSVGIKWRDIGEVNFSKYLINIIVFSFSILCLTFLINNITRNKFVINGLSTALALGVSFISGVMVPQQFLGEKVLSIAKFFPTYYYVRINDMNINSLFDIRYELSMQLLFALAFLLMGLYFSKVRQRV